MAAESRIVPICMDQGAMVESGMTVLATGGPPHVFFARSPNKTVRSCLIIQAETCLAYRAIVR